jgi:hypothetical protein
MNTLKGIPILSGSPVRSGEKYLSVQGVTAIKDGIKARGEPDRGGLSGKPRWLAAAGGRGLRGGASHGARASARHRVRGSEMPEHR